MDFPQLSSNLSAGNGTDLDTSTIQDDEGPEENNEIEEFEEEEQE